jgi:hypothetical protein
MFKLDEIHLEKAKEMAVRNRTKKKCKLCYDRGYIGVTPENLLVPCHKCVDIDKVMEEWKVYVAEIPELKEYFADLFEEKKEDENSEQE